MSQSNIDVRILLKETFGGGGGVGRWWWWRRGTAGGRWTRAAGSSTPELAAGQADQCARGATRDVVAVDQRLEAWKTTQDLQH